MTTPYTIIRCRMKDLISCFNACKLPIEKDSNNSDHQKPQPSSISGDRHCERAQKADVGTTAERGGGGESPVSWRSCESEEDDYIVFCFKDDDARGEVVEERGLGTKHAATCANPRKKETYQQSTGKIQDDAMPNESEQHKYTLSESSDSSTSSFVFPTIQKEWIGSPVLMPRPEAHNKSCGVCIQFCKF